MLNSKTTGKPFPKEPPGGQHKEQSGNPNKIYSCFKYLLLAALQLKLICVVAQQPYSLIHYDENVLPQTSVGNIQQSKDGYLWMSTQFGIVRFDGEMVRVYTTANLKGLTSNRIRACAASLDGSVYFVDENNVLIKAKSPNQFETVSVAERARKSSLPLYSRESNNDFAYLNFESQDSYKEFIDSMKIDMTRELLKSYATGEKEGYFFYADFQQKVRLCYYHDKLYTTQQQSDSFRTQHTFKLGASVFIQIGVQHALLFDKTEQKKSIPVTGLPAGFAGDFKADPPVLFSGASGTFFYSSGQLYQYELKVDHVEARLIFKDLPCVGVVNVMKERSTGDFLISTKSTGFYRIKTKRFSVVNLTAATTAGAGGSRDFNNNIVYSLALWDETHLFFNGYITPVSGGVSKDFNSQNKVSIDYYFLHPKDSTHFWMNMGNGMQALMQSFDKITGSCSPLVTIAQPKKAVELANGVSILVGGSNIVALQDNKVTELNKNEGAEYTTVEKLTDDSLVVGSRNGVNYFNPHSRKFRPVPYKEPLNVRFIFKDRAGLVWFTTYGQGLFHLSGDSIVPLPLDNARYLSISHSIVEDQSGHFWVPTNHGLFKLGYASLLSIIRHQGKKLYYTYYDKTDGFNTNEFNGGCYPSTIYQPETGLVFFPSMNGVIKFNPDSLPEVKSSSPVFFDEIVFNDTGRIQSINDKTVFPKQTSSLRIDFSSPYYGHTENIKFSYSLSNDPDVWKELPRGQSVTLSNLPGGNYTLVIKKEEPTSAPILASFQFEIQKKFVETVLFKLLLLAVVVGLVYLYFRARLYYLHKERRRLEELVALKTADQLKLIDQLKETIAHLTQLQLEMEQMIEHKESILAVLIHDIKSPLHFLNTVAELLYKGIDVNSPQKNREISQEISTSINRLYLFTQDFAIWLHASQPGQIQKKEKADLDKIVQEVLSIYKEIIDKKGIRIQTQITCNSVYGDEPMIKSIIRNLVDNAVKNTADANITITGIRGANEGLCEIVIADEGKGMTSEQISAINKYFLADDDVLPFSSLGYGHKVIKDFVHKSGGTIRYGQNDPAGIIATVVLPVTGLAG